MKMKRVLALFLSILVVSTALLSGCGKKEVDEDEVNAEAEKQVVTLNMYILTKEETKPEQALAVQLAINELTLQSYKTKLKINYLTEDMYWNAIEETLTAIDDYEAALAAEKEAAKAAKRAGATADNAESTAGQAEETKPAEEAKDKAENEEGTEEEEEVSLDEELDQLFKEGDIVLEHPQIDILVFNNYSKYRDFVNQNRLAPLDDYLNLNSKVLRTYIFPSYLEVAKLGTNSTYGIPVNGPISAYEYFVFDKELADKYGFDPASVKTFTDLEGYLATIKANEPDIIPLNRGTSPADYEFFDKDGSAMGVLRKQTDTDWPAKCLSIFEEEEVVDHYRAINRFRKAGYLPDDDVSSDARYAVQILEGTASSPEHWQERDGREYTCVVYKTPKLTNGNAMNGVFAISSKSYNKDRSMEIIKEFNTNPELANLLQWGIRDVHYYLHDANDSHGTISLIEGSGYVMDNDITGNKYIKYRLATEPDEFEAQKEQNLNSWMGGLAGFNPNLGEFEDVLTAANEATVKYYPDLIGGYGDFDEIMTEMLGELNNVYNVGTFQTFISHKIGGDYNNYAAAMNEAYPGGGTSAEEVSEVEEEETEEEAEGEEEVPEVAEETAPETEAAVEAETEEAA